VKVAGFVNPSPPLETMLGITNMVAGALVSSLWLQSADPILLFAGATASLLPDIDSSRSFAGSVFPFISSWLEATLPHRSCTHSFAASVLLALVTYPAAGVGLLPWDIAHALNLGYFTGWFLDVFSKNGVEMFWPSGVRAVCPGNREYRLTTGSTGEYFVLAFLSGAALIVFHLNSQGGLLVAFNRFIAAPSGVIQVLNEKGSTHLITATLKGVRSTDRSPITGTFWVIQQTGAASFLVVSAQGELYKAGTEGDCQILVDSVVADAGIPATTTLESIVLQEDPLINQLASYQRPQSLVFVTGQLVIEEEPGAIPLDPNQFQSIRIQGTLITFESAPLSQVLTYLGNQFATGTLSLRSIFVSPYSHAKTPQTPPASYPVSPAIE
jgi:inner membrane protein